MPTGSDLRSAGSKTVLLDARLLVNACPSVRSSRQTLAKLSSTRASAARLASPSTSGHSRYVIMPSRWAVGVVIQPPQCSRRARVQARHAAAVLVHAAVTAALAKAGPIVAGAGARAGALNRYWRGASAAATRGTRRRTGGAQNLRRQSLTSGANPVGLEQSQVSVPVHDICCNIWQCICTCHLRGSIQGPASQMDAGM